MLKTTSPLQFQLRTGLSFLIAATALAQGPLAPTGTPAPSLKSLNQIDARIATAGQRIPVNDTNCPGDAASRYAINQSGSYFLTGDVVVSTALNGITINASGVTLDLNGYELSGPNQAGLSGIVVNGSYVTVRGGRSSHWQNGFQINQGNAVFEELIAAQNSGTGFYTSGAPVRFESCTASFNGNGFFASGACHFIACAANNSFFRGFDFLGGCLAVGCTTFGGDEGFVLDGPGDVVRDCVASQFGTYGFDLRSDTGGGAVQHCVASTNSSGAVAGFRVSTPATMVADCTSRCDGSPSGLAYGFDGGGAYGAMFLRCSATGWNGAGFSLDQASTAMGCNASGNGGDGIVFNTGCAITGNNVRQNGGEGLSATDVDNRVDGNVSSGNGASGIRSYDSSNVIIRNVARGNGTDYNPPTALSQGPVGSPATATSPWANF